MAIPLRTFGNTLTDLQAGTNAAQGLDYSRANAQDTINQQRLDAFLRLQGQKYALQAQNNALAADWAMRFAELAQQNQQFRTSEANRMDLGKLAAKTHVDVANATKGGIDPRAFEAMLVYNQQGLDKVATAKALSARRKALVDEIKAANNGWGLFNNSPEYDNFKAAWGRAPDAKSAGAALAALDISSAAVGLTPNDYTGGYSIPDFEPVVPPSRGTTPAPTTGGSPPVIQSNTQPAQVPAMLQGDVTFGGKPFFGQPGLTVPDALAPSTVVAPAQPTLKWNGTNWVQ